MTQAAKVYSLLGGYHTAIKSPPTDLFRREIRPPSGRQTFKTATTTLCLKKTTMTFYAITSMHIDRF